MLVALVGMPLQQHYCHDQVVATSFYGTAEVCAPGEADFSLAWQGEICCYDQNSWLAGWERQAVQSELALTLGVISPTLPQFALVAPTLITTFATTDAPKHQDRDLRILYQSLVI